jgi:hypothetical protein
MKLCFVSVNGPREPYLLDEPRISVVVFSHIDINIPPDLRPNENSFNILVRESFELIADVLETVTNLIHRLHKLLYHAQFYKRWP